jgi:hypothetical protein
MRISVLLEVVKLATQNFSPTLKIQCENCLKPKLINKMELNVGFRTESDFAAAASDAAGTSPLQAAQLPLFS